MVPSRRKLPPRKLRPVPTDCPFCQRKMEMSFLQSDSLKNYISERGKIIGKDRSGICSKHQRRLSREIKRARFLGLLPFSVQIK